MTPEVRRLMFGLIMRFLLTNEIKEEEKRKKENKNSEIVKE